MTFALIAHKGWYTIKQRNQLLAEVNMPRQYLQLRGTTSTQKEWLGYDTKLNPFVSFHFWTFGECDITSV